MFDLKLLRERAGLTQTHLAKRLKTSQVQISRYESAPGNVPISMIQDYLAALGLDLATEISRASNRPPAVPVAIHKPYEYLWAKLERSVDYLESFPDTGQSATAFLSQADELIKSLRHAARKPTLLITGNFDVGKSHLANYLLGQRCLPTGYQPETRIPIYVRHVNDRPSFIQEDVWIMGEGFLPECWSDLAHAESHKKIGGNISTLNDWAAHSSPHAEGLVAAALVFVDAPVLEGCDLIDVPGNMHSIDDQPIAESLLSAVDMVIYASSAKGFLSGSDMVQLHHIRQNLRASSIELGDEDSIGRLVIVATHADPSISDNALAEIMRRGGERLHKEWCHGESESCTLSAVKEQIVSFWEEEPGRSRAFIQWFQKTFATKLPALKEQRIDSLIRGFTKGSQQHYLSKISALRNVMGSDAIATNLASESLQVGEKRQEIIVSVIELREKSQALISDVFLKTLSLQQVTEMITELYPDRDQARQYAAARLTNQIQVQVSERIQQQLTELLPQLQLYMDDLSQPYLPASMQEDGGIPVNARGLLLGGVAGLASVGPFAAWAAQLGQWGGYLVVAQGAGSLGISAAGASSIVSIVVAIGGPAVLATAMVATGAVVGASVLGRNWQVRLAERIVRSIKESGYEDRLVSACREYWENTLLQFEHNSQSLESDTQKARDELHSIQEADGAEAYLNQLIVQAEYANKVVSEIPWLTEER